MTPSDSPDIEFLYQHPSFRRIGIDVEEADGAKFIGNHIEDMDTGIRVKAANNSIFAFNTIRGYSGDGLSVGIGGNFSQNELSELIRLIGLERVERFDQSQIEDISTALRDIENELTQVVNPPRPSFIRRSLGYLGGVLGYSASIATLIVTIADKFSN